MFGRQTLAKLGVFVLLGLNAGAYWIFWPRNAERRDVVAEPAPVEIAPKPVKPKSLPEVMARSAAPLAAPKLPGTKTEDAAVISRLLEQITKDTPTDGAPLPTFVAPTPPIAPVVAPLPKPGILPPLKAEPIDGDARQRPEADVAIASALTPKQATNLWIIETRPLGTQTLLLVKTRPTARLPVSFEIRGDRVDVQAPGGVQAHGHVTFAGAGIKGSCRRLSVRADKAAVIFEDDVRIAPTNADGTQLRGERFLWEQAESGIELDAIQFRPAGLLLPAKGVLGAPK